jgi:hypothetical protein
MSRSEQGSVVFIANLASTVTSSFVSSGDSATATMTLSPGAYHWQARAEDYGGATSTWQLFGPTSTSTDFQVASSVIFEQPTHPNVSNPSTGNVESLYQATGTVSTLELNLPDAPYDSIEEFTTNLYECIAQDYWSNDASGCTVVASSSRPMTELLAGINDFTLPPYTLNPDRYYTWEATTSTPLNIKNGLSDREFDVVGTSAYLNTVSLVPGEVVSMDLLGCTLYTTWSNSMCTDSIVQAQHWGTTSSSTFVSWAGENGAKITLTGASLDSWSGSSTLLLSFNIRSGYGEFCPSIFSSRTLRVDEDERGDTSQPLPILPVYDDACIGPNETSTQEIGWGILPSSTPLTVSVKDQSGNQETFFNLYPLLDRVLFVQPAP